MSIMTPSSAIASAGKSPYAYLVSVSGKNSCCIMSKKTELDRRTLEYYKAFMIGYVRRINESTLNVPISGVRIGSARYSRLAQINLKSRIITFSRYAIDKVPERGRRYLVLHELAHVKEPSHNKRFWSLVKCFEPDYKEVEHQLERAFKRNVNSNDCLADNAKRPTPREGVSGNTAVMPVRQLRLASETYPGEGSVLVVPEETTKDKNSDLLCRDDTCSEVQMHFDDITNGDSTIPVQPLLHRQVD